MENAVGIPDDLRCKRSDGKQWRCTVMSMPDKTVCEKHYIQAKKRAANSAMRANLKKAKRKSLGESDIYLESKSDEFDTLIASSEAVDYSSSGKRMSKSSQRMKKIGGLLGHRTLILRTRWGTCRRKLRRYSDISVEEIERICPACRGTCSCTVWSQRPKLNLAECWVAKLVKNVEEMVGGCRIYDTMPSQKADLDNPQIFRCAHRENSDDNMLYFPTSQDLKSDGIDNFRKHWAQGEPIIVKQIFDDSSVSSWDPINIWRGIRERTDEKIKDENRMVKAIDCSNWSEVEVKLSQFIKGYSEGRIHDNDRSKMLKLKDWPSSNASEEFILYQGPECISKLPLLEYIHSKWGLLNVAAKMPHYSLQSDVGPKILISYGTHEEIDGDAYVTNLSLNLRDMVYLLVHTSALKLKELQKTSSEKMEETLKLSEEKESPGDQQTCSDERRSLDLSPDSYTVQNDNGRKVDPNEDVTMMDLELEPTSSQEETNVNSEFPIRDFREVIGKTRAGAVWDVFRRKDVPKLAEYLRLHWKEFRKADGVKNDLVTGPLYDEALFLSKYHKRKLKEEFGVEPWSFEQYLGQAVFVPAGCPFQVQNLQIWCWAWIRLS